MGQSRSEDRRKAERVENLVMPNKLASADSACRDENRRWKLIFLQDRKCVLIVVAVSIIECNGNCPFGNIAPHAPRYEFRQAQHRVTTLEKPHLLLEGVGMQGLEERVLVRRYLVVSENLESSRKMGA